MCTGVCCPSRSRRRSERSRSDPPETDDDQRANGACAAVAAQALGLFYALLEHGLIPTVHDWGSAVAVSDFAREPTGVYAKAHSGLGRLGIRLVDARDFIHRLLELNNIRLDGVYTHLSFHAADQLEWAQQRYAAFDRLLDALAADGIEVPVTQALASAGLMAGLHSRANSVCPGALLYGMTPVDDGVAVSGNYRPVVRAIKSRLIHIGETGDASNPARVGVLPIGLADGYQAIRPGADAYVLLDGRRVAIRGVSLEYIVLDLGHLDGARVGDEVVLLGESGSEQIDCPTSPGGRA